MGFSGEAWYYAQTKFNRKLIFWDINLKFGTQLLQIFDFDSLAVLEWNMFRKIYILYKYLNV